MIIFLYNMNRISWYFQPDLNFRTDGYKLHMGLQCVDILIGYDLTIIAAGFKFQAFANKYYWFLKMIIDRGCIPLAGSSKTHIISWLILIPI